MFLSLSNPMLPIEWNGWLDCGSLKLMMSTASVSVSPTVKRATFDARAAVQ